MLLAQYNINDRDFSLLNQMLNIRILCVHIYNITIFADVMCGYLCTRGHGSHHAQ